MIAVVRLRFYPAGEDLWLLPSRCQKSLGLLKALPLLGCAARFRCVLRIGRTLLPQRDYGSRRVLPQRKGTGDPGVESY